MFTFSNLDLLSVGVVIAAIGILGFTIFFNDTKSYTNRFFLFFCLMAVAWSTVNYFSYQPSRSIPSIWLLRAVIFFATWLVFALFSLLYVFPSVKVNFSIRYKLLSFPSAILISLLNLTPFVFVKVARFNENGSVDKVEIGPLIAIFGLYVFSLVISGILLLIKKTAKANGEERKQFRTIAIGISLTFTLLLIFNFVLPAFFSTSVFIPLGAMFIFPFVLFTGYAIFHYKLLRLKVLSAQILIFALALASFAEIIFTNNLPLIIFRSFIFLLVLSAGILLIRSVIKEVSQREQLQKLTEQLEDANEKLKLLDQARADFITIASHQLRTPPATLKWYLSAIKSGDYGKIDPEVMQTLAKAEATNNSQISLIDDLLNASRIERGKMEFMFDETDMEAITQLTVDQLLPLAEMKGLKLVYQKPVSPLPHINADKEKLRQVINNLIDNSIKYTPTGTVKVKLLQEGDNIKFSVSDTGKGVATDVLDTLFEKYTRGKDSVTHSTGLGLGLYVAKVIIEQHTGRIWVESPGEGKGSTFLFTVPIKNSITGISTYDLARKGPAAPENPPTNEPKV